MSVRQTRRQAAAAAAAAAATAESPKIASEEPIEQVAMNGNGNGNTLTESSENVPKENIFLFWPNIIGMVISRSSNVDVATLTNV